VFEKYYKQHLAKRLLHGRSSSEDAGADRNADVLLSYCSSRIIVFCRCHAASLVHVKPLPLRRGCTAQDLAALHCGTAKVFTLLTLRVRVLGSGTCCCPFRLLQSSCC
jgi:hypothetical protein